MCHIGAWPQKNQPALRTKLKTKYQIQQSMSSDVFYYIFGFTYQGTEAHMPSLTSNLL